MLQVILKLTGIFAVVSFLAIACGGGDVPTQAPQNTVGCWIVTERGAGGAVPPHACWGTVHVDGATSVDGTQFTAFLEGVPDSVAGTTVTDGRYVIKIVQRSSSSTLFADRKITFKIGGRDGSPTAVWISGSADELNIAVGSSAPPAVDAPPPVEVPAGSLAISTEGDTLKFDQASLEAKAGSTVTVVFQNASTINQHNWVLVQSGTKDEVAAAGTEAGAEADWIPSGDDRVLAKSGLLEPGGTQEVRFTVPAAGTYQFVCTFPGHNFTMFGDFIVTP